ncbi:MAG TPA: GNAT family N-acetyltransferase [Solirubrobacteraceae bacterium]|jgi:ribosomal protein S18 acetylase RimI-like enzyme
MAARPPLDVRPLERRDEPAARAILGRAFLDDPAWIAVGPRSLAHRRMVMRAYYPGVLAAARRWGGPLWCAEREGRPIGVALAFDEGKWPPPQWRIVYEMGVVLGGPGPFWRGLKWEEITTPHHPTEPHVYLWQLATDPTHQRTGAGRSLLERLSDSADERGLPIWLETTKPENVAYYRGSGFAVEGEEPLPRGATVWFMRRPASGAARYA